MKTYTEFGRCRICNSVELLPAINLGNIAISDFPDWGGSLEYAPLEVVRCKTCDLVQLRHSVQRDLLYRKYHYLSGLNETMVTALRDVVECASHEVNLREGDAVLDIGANDGTLLRQYPETIKRYGLEPSNVCPPVYPVEPNFRVWNDYFPSKTVDVSLWGPFKIITAIAMFYDLDDPGAFLDAAKQVLAPDGVLVIQMPDIWQMIRLNAFDNICHEHVTYWPTRTLYHFARAHGFRLAQMTNNSVNGGSLRFYFKHCDPDPNFFPGQPQGVLGQDLFEFAKRVNHLRSETTTVIRSLQTAGNTVWAYGASTKGNTLLQYYDLTNRQIDAVADRNPEKHGKTTVTGIPIVSEECFRRHHPDYALMLPWGFQQAFVNRESDWLETGGKFIIPLPDLRVIGDRDASLQSKILAPKTRTIVPS